MLIDIIYLSGLLECKTWLKSIKWCQILQAPIINFKWFISLYKMIEKVQQYSWAQGFLRTMILLKEHVIHNQIVNMWRFGGSYLFKQ